MLDALFSQIPDHFILRMTLAAVILSLVILLVVVVFPPIIYGLVWFSHRLEGKKGVVCTKTYFLLLLLMRTIVLLLGLIVSAEFLGVRDQTVWAIVISFLGFSLSFSFRDTFTHIIAGLALLLMNHPRLEDPVCVYGPTNVIHGTLKDVGMFTCTIESEGVSYFIPNATMVTSITSNSRNAPPESDPRSQNAIKSTSPEPKDFW